MELTTLNIKAELTLEDLVHFFSYTHEFQVVQTKADTFKITFDGNSEKLDTLIYKPTMQTLIRCIVGIAYLDGHQYNVKNK